MKINKRTIKHFEKEQKEYGTEVAIYNLIWLIASDLFKSIGCKRVKTK